MIELSYPNVLVIDSGVGGLSVTQEIRARCPNINVFYIADRAQFPYGNKSEQEVSGRTHALVAYAIEKFKPNLVVLACNTASTVALESLRHQFDIPFVGVVPAIKPAVKHSQSGVIGVLATEGTINRSYTKNLIQSFAEDKHVYLYGSAALVREAENKLRGIDTDHQLIKDDVNTLVKQEPAMDTIVLACTHFPLLKPELEILFPQIRYWVDSGSAIARRVEFLLAQTSSASPNRSEHNQLLVTGTAAIDYKINLLTPLLGKFEASLINI